MRSTSIYLLDIPLDDRFRQHLRVYGIGNLSDVFDVRVRVLEGNLDAVLADFPMRLTLGQVSGLPEKNEFPTHPAYGEITSLRSLVGSSIERVRVEVIPQTPGVRFWAFVAVTNNETQHVTLVTPQ